MKKFELGKSLNILLSRTLMKYDGERTAKGLWKWIKKNHSKADIIKERIESGCPPGRKYTSRRLWEVI